LILEEITVKNWRAYREPHTFRFKQGINLLVGRNEAGKSTLFEALTRALFDRHNSKAEEIRAIQPIASTLGPEVEVQFVANGIRYKAVKRFLQDPKSELYAERKGGWELDHEGDQSDARLREILNGDTTSRTVARSEHRGLAQALWYLQSDGPIPEKTWNEGVRQGLQGLVHVAARAPEEMEIVELLDQAFMEHWTPTGRIASDSELGHLENEIPVLEESLSSLHEKARAVERYRVDLEENRNNEAQKESELEQAGKELETSSQLAKAAEQLEREKENKEHVLSDAQDKARRLHQELTQIRDRQKRIAEWRAQIPGLEQSVFDAMAYANQEEAASERHAKYWKEELEPALRGVEDSLRVLETTSKTRRLQKDRDRLDKHLEKVSKLHTQVQSRTDERSALLTPTTKERNRFNKITENLGILDAKVVAGAVRVAFDWEGKARKITTKPLAKTTDEGEFIVAEPTEFNIRGLGRVRIRSGAETLKELLQQRTEHQEENDETLAHFGVKNSEGLAGLYEKGRDLDRLVAGLQEKLEEAIDEEPDAESDLIRVKREIEDCKRATDQFPPEVATKNDAWIQEEIALKKGKKESLITEIEKTQLLEKKAREKQMEFVRAHESSSNALSEKRAQIQTFEEGTAEMLQPYGTLNRLQSLEEESKDQSEKAKAALDDFLKGYDERVETPRKLHAQTQERVNDLKDQIGVLRENLAGTLARIEESAAQSNYSQLADLEIQLNRKAQRKAVLQHRANGAKLLHDLVVAYDRERFSALSGPIENLVNRWLQLLTEGTYDALRIDDTLKPAGVRAAGYHADIPMTSLSHGTHEQVVVLLRLAIGFLVSGAERNLVVIDDRLVNADSIRMKRLGLILKEAEKACQLVVATCNDTPYAGLGAHILRVPSDGLKCREASIP
jgi:hypothetical protein